MQQILQALLDHFGPQHWWPGDSRFEIAVGAILTQNTSWRNVEQGLRNLRLRGLLDPLALHQAPESHVAELLRPVGYFRLKARRLRNFVDWLVDRCNGSMDAAAELDSMTLRQELLALNGIGPETADSILLYALDKPRFVVDAYTHRLASRHGWVSYDATYQQIKDYFESRLPENAQTFNELHALIVQTGKQYCRRREPLCQECPLREFLPNGAIVARD